MDLTGLSILNARAARLPGPNLLHQLVKAPSQHVALDYMGNGQQSALNYSQMHEAAASLAARITATSGNTHGQFVVPVLIHQSPVLYISLLAILKAGGAFCPLNIDAPPERVKFILGDVAATVLLVTKELASEIPRDISATIIIVDENEEGSGLARYQSAELKHRVPQPEDLAYVMYTSGSTGTPKGVGISHDAASQALIAHDKHIPPFSRFLQFAAPTFDVSVFEIFFPLFRGATLVSVRRVEMLDDLPGVLRTMRIDACELTPTVAGSLLRRRANAPDLKVLLTIGEMLNAPVVEEFGGDDEKPSMLWAMYGPTEATIHCTLQTAFSSDSSTGNIGVPLDTVSCFIIEILESDSEQSEMKILPQGEVGELAVGGYQLANGYLNRPEQTNSVFVDSPFGRIYRTGDKARLLPNGKLECFGRLSDGQVKLRGQRLELGEVEQAVLRTSGCHSSVAAIVRSILVVFCAVDEGVTEDAVLKHCRDWLPQYMVPREVILMPEFPRLPSGKVDRKRLKAEYEEHKADISEGTLDSEPMEGTELELLAIVSRVLNFKVDKSMSLATIGMDSLKAIKLASALRNSGYGLDSTALLTMKTISEILSAVLRQMRNQPANPQQEPADLSLDFSDVVRQENTIAGIDDLVEHVIPCTPLQTAMLAETVRNPTAYCNELELTIPLNYTIDRISETFKELSQHNAILRAGFVVVDGKFVMLVHRKLRPEQIRIVDRFEAGLSLSSPQDFYSPMVFQIQRTPVEDRFRVFLQLHHSIYDGWSMDILLSDWSKLLLKEPVSQHPSFREVIRFYHHLQTDDSARVFWTEHLSGWKRMPLPKLHDKIMHSSQTLSSRRPLSLSRSRVDIEMYKLGCSPQVIFQASLALLWSGITGTRDITIGSVTSGRTISVTGIEQVVGPCIASLPVRVDLEKVSVSLDLLNSIHSSNRMIMHHCTLSLSEIKKLVGLQPGESLYDALFVYQESLTSSERTKNVVKETSHLDRLETPILFEVEPTEDGFILQVTYQEAFVSPTTVENMANQFESLAVLILEDSAREIKSTLREVNCSPSIHNVTPALPQQTPDLARLFEDVVRKSPDLDALLFANSLESDFQIKWSFRELNAAANQIARYLQRCGIRVGQVVAIVMEKSPTLYASILGIMKSGCGYLPILPSTPLARTEEILLQAQTEYCLVDKTSPDRHSPFPGLSIITVDVDSINELPTDNLDIAVDGSRLAYVIYTSGTTGTPKGVAIQQQSIAANIEHLETVYPKPLSSRGRLLQACSQAFDVSVFEIFYTWCAGMCLCSGTNDTILEDIERSIRDLEITHLSMTPTVAALVNPSNVPGVEFLITAGEPMTQSVYDRWQRQLWQGYGPSETTNICTVKKMAADDHIEHLGHVFPNTSVVVLSPESSDTVPLNWVGEFCFGGAQVARGYLNMQELTAQKFTQHPQYGRLYRSGDMGRMLSDGSLVILGRIDDQVKLRGQRIEIGEINSTATSTGLAFSAATLLVQREEASPKQLALFFVPRHEPSNFHVLEVNSETQQSLVAHLQSRLPSYMVPSYLIPISSVPMTSSGKIDKRRLRTCFDALDQIYLESASRMSLGTQEEGDWSQMDLAIAEAITESAKVSKNHFGRWTTFTLLGIDSISAIDLARTLSSKLGTRVAVSEILRNPTVAQLARYLDGKAPQQEEAAFNDLQEFFSTAFMALMKERFVGESKTIKDILPCTPLQEAMLSRGQKGYYNKVLLRLTTGSGAMKSYWKTMSDRHDILRTCFAATTDSQRAIAQIVIEDWEIPWRTFDVNELSFDGAIEEHLKSLPDPVDSRTPPVSLALLRYRGSEFLSFICHHALYDGVAMERLLKEVEALAGGEALPPPVPYGEFLKLSTNLPSDTEQFWQQHFEGYKPSSIFSQTTTSEVDQSTCTTSMDILLSDIQGRIRDLGTTLLSVCQASWASVLAMAYRRSDVCFGNVVSGRTLDIEGLERLIAPCFNTIPVRVDFSVTSSNIDIVKHLQKMNTQLLAYQFTPLRLIQRNINRTGKHIFDTLLLLQKPLQDIDKNVWTLEGDSGDMDIPLVCEIVPCPGLNSLVINMHRDMSIVTEEVATAMADAFKLTLRAILTTPHASLTSKKDLPDTLRSIMEQLEPRHEKVNSAAILSDKEEEWNELELQVRQVLATLSGVSDQRIQRRTTIFQLGLDSINAVQVASILRQRGFVISASDVIECPSCSKIAAKLLENSSRTNTEDVQKYDLGRFSRHVSIEVADQIPRALNIEAILPCTPVQSAMLASFIQSGGDNYLNAVRYVTTENIPLDRLQKAWHQLSERHPMLRTGFVPVQHSDTSFAMVRYVSDSVKTPLSVMQLEWDDTTDLLEIKADASKSILPSMHRPPWTVVLTQTPQSTTMNLIAHHALYDAPALHLMLNELSQLVKGKQLPPVSKIEPAVSAILSKALSNKSLEKVFWEAKARKTVVNKFPIMTPLREEERHVLTDATVASLSFTKLKQATQASNVTIQAVIQAAWTRVLAAYLGENSVVFGVALSGRTVDEIKDAVFPCLNTVPIVASNVASNNDLVNYMMDYNQHLHKHQFSPLSQVQKWLGHPADPIFDTLIAYQKMPNVDSLPTPWKLVKDEAKVEYPVSLEIEPTEKDLIRLCITYYSDVLPREQAQLLMKQFDASLAHIALNTAGAEDDAMQHSPSLYSVLPASAPTLDAPVQLLHQFVERGAIVHPDKVALEFVSGFNGDACVKQQWNYRQLNSMGNKVANMLHDQVTPGEIVAVHFDKCPEAYFSILGILKTGCAFVALDPSAPKARKKFIIEDSKAPCLLTRRVKDLDFEVKDTIIEVDTENLNGVSEEHLIFQSTISPSETCYCLYTSGTTGTPKGCEITHDNAVQAMMAFQDLFKGHWDDDSRWLQFAALHFDVSVLEQYWSWSVGMAVIAAPKDLILDDLTGSINKLGITHIDLTPSLARLTHPDEVPGLCRGVFITGGEQLKQEILDVWGPKAVIYNAYGPTEATIGVTMFQRVPINGRPSNIGKQFPNVGSFVFRQNTNTPVFRGGVGELCVSGKLVGKGYLNRPELTEERFPTLSEFNERVYRTGDLVRVLHDGCFDFLGRVDDQVKLRGQRLEIAEINQTIRTDVADVHDAATIVAQHGTSGKDVLVTFVVGQNPNKGPLEILSDEKGLAAQAKEACRAKLPGYMVPTYILLLPYIPLSSNNKAEIKDLKKLFSELTPEKLMELSHATTVPISQGAQKIMSNLLEIVANFSDNNRNDLSSSTSILDVGVDSITALRLSSLLKSRGLKAASPALLLKNPVIGDLANYLAKNTSTNQEKLVREVKQSIQAYGHRHRGMVCRNLNVKPADIEYIAPCSPLQQGIISRSMTSSEPGAYFNTFELKLQDSTSTERLRQAWSSLILSESILRSVFVPTTDGFLQVALRSPPLAWESQTGQSDEMVKTYLVDQKERWIQRNESSITQPLLLTYVETPASRLLTVHIFHALYDGNSFDLMMQRIAAIYTGIEPPRAPSFLEALSHGPLAKHDNCRDFWEDHLEGWTPAPIQQRGSGESEPAAITEREIPIASLEAIRSAQNVTLQAVVMALWTAVLQNVVQRQPTIGVVVSGRAIDLPGVENTIGPLFNTVPFYCREVKQENWKSLVRRCHEFNASVLDFQHVPLKDVQKWCSKGKALFDNLFTFQIEVTSVPSEAILPFNIADSHASADYPLAIEAVYTEAGRLRLTLVAQGHVASPEVLSGIIDEIQRLADLAASSPESEVPVSETEQPYTGNGHNELRQTQNQNNFEWSYEARVIQDEVALLAGAPPSDIAENVSILELGLDSIDVIKLSAKLKKKGINLAPSQIMRYQTIAKILAESDSLCLKSTSSAEDASLLHIKKKLREHLEGSGTVMDHVESVLPPTHLQESMVAGMIQSGFESYFNHDVLRVSDHVDIMKLIEAWKKLFHSTPILRTGFIQVDNQDLDMAYCQVVSKSFDVDFEVIQIEDLSELKEITAAANAMAKEARGEKHLAQLRLVNMGAQRYMVLSMAHALYDGWSLSLLFEDLQALFEGKSITRPPVEPFLDRMLGCTSEGAQDFWMQYLENASPSIIPTRETRLHPIENTVIRSESVSNIGLAEIEAACKRLSVSLQVLCQACWAITLARQIKSLDVTFGTVLSGRDLDGADSLVFPTMNTVALRCILHGSVPEFLRYLEDNMNDIRDFQHYPLRRAQAATKLTGQSLFNTLFILQKSPASTDSPDRPLLTSIEGSSATEYPLCVEAEAVSDTLIWRFALHPHCVWDGPPESLLESLDSVMRYLVKPGSSEVLSFEENGVSICGLPSLVLGDSLNSAIADSTDSSFERNVEWSQAETRIREVLHQVSGIPIPSIEVSDSLYHLGLDSISAIKVSSLLRKMGVNLGPQDLVKSSSISEMAQRASESQVTVPQTLKTIEKWVPPKDINIEDLLRVNGIAKEHATVLPALPMQVYMLSAWQNSQGSVFFPEFFCRLQTSVGFGDIQNAWDKLVSEIPLLRTCFIATQSLAIPILQVILKTHKISLSETQSGNEPDERTEPLVAAHITLQEDHNWLLRLRIHHALYDGVSLPALLQRFSQLLKGAITVKDNGLSQWKHFTALHAAEAARSDRREFWTAYLQGVSSSSICTESQADVKHRVSHFNESAIPDISPIQALTASSGISFQSLFLAAYARIHAKLSNTTEDGSVIFGIYLANRAAANDRLPQVYPTLNLVPLRVDSPVIRPLSIVARDVQRDIHQITSDARSNVGLWEIAEWTGVQITSFVNFLSLSNGIDSSQDSVTVLPEQDADSPGNDHTFKVALQANMLKLKHNIPVGCPVLGMQGRLLISPASQMAVDIEASINNGHLGIGIFGSQQQISRDQAAQLASSIADALNESIG
ncbi:non-ribosomal peptide synthetase [Fusarium austroafricanum]|uniref:Non-ribosomal peptide synthetase n=1 Tax=Fusarium austroafricanum TaxID=2364996 RepID=A0A8H4P0S9_9HYPO|nr:non-ribosomal peptide synthetase [Fusarium austroafricanum]